MARFGLALAKDGDRLGCVLVLMLSSAIALCAQTARPSPVKNRCPTLVPDLNARLACGA